MRTNRLFPCAPALLVLVACVSAPAADLHKPTAPAPVPMLNSERIEQRFGNYGVEVLEAHDSVRVSNLFSVADAVSTTRTFAVVLFPAEPDPRLVAEHRQVVAGGSIGAVFKAAGWSVSRRHRYIGTRPAPEKADRLAVLMGEIVAPELAFEVYTLVVSRDGGALDYATIAEIHHPEHLTPAELAQLHPRGAHSTADLPAGMLELVIAATKGPVVTNSP